MYKKITRGHLESFLKKYASNERVLDVGSGGSSYAKYFPNRITLDIDPQRHPEIIGDAHNLPFKEGEFEMILCTEVLEHTKNPFQVADEFYRVLKPGGILILTTRFVYPLHDVPHDYFRYTKYGLKELFKKWNIIEIKSETKNFSAIAALLQRICFQSKLRFNKASKFLIFLLSAILNKMDFLTVGEYGDIKRENTEEDILTTGYYLVAKK